MKRSNGGLNPLIIIGALFFIFGFVTWMSSVLIPYLQIACELDNFQSYLVAFAFYISYFIMAIPSGKLLKITGFKNGMSIGLLLVAAGSMIFIPAAIYRTYPVFLLGLFVQGAGLAVLQTASNPYVTILGPEESAAKRMSLMGICNGVAGIIAPAILGAIILNNADNIISQISRMTSAEHERILNALARKVIFPYVIITVILMVLAFIVYRSRLPEIDEDPVTGNHAAAIFSNPKKSIFEFPYLWIGVFTLFLYVGVEVIAGNTIIQYGTYQGISINTAKFFTSFTLIGMLAGYLIGIICIPKYFTQESALKFSAIAGIIFTLMALYTTGYVSVMFIALLGLSNSLMYPSIWPLAIGGLGKFTKVGSSLLVMAISGGAILPLLYGWLADHANAQQAYWMVIPCYVAVGYFAIAGHKVGRALSR